MLIEILMVLMIIIIIVWFRNRPLPGIKEIKTNELQAMLKDKDKLFVDVRSVREYKKQKIYPFINMSISSDLSTLPKDKDIIVMCQNGERGKETCRQLRKLGFTQKLSYVQGGYDAFTAQKNKGAK